MNDEFTVIAAAPICVGQVGQEKRWSVHLKSAVDVPCEMDILLGWEKKRAPHLTGEDAVSPAERMREAKRKLQAEREREARKDGTPAE